MPMAFINGQHRWGEEPNHSALSHTAQVRKLWKLLDSSNAGTHSTMWCIAQRGCNFLGRVMAPCSPISRGPEGCQTGLCIIFYKELSGLSALKTAWILEPSDLVGFVILKVSGNLSFQRSLQYFWTSNSVLCSFMGGRVAKALTWRNPSIYHNLLVKDYYITQFCCGISPKCLFLKK